MKQFRYVFDPICSDTAVSQVAEVINKTSSFVAGVGNISHELVIICSDDTPAESILTLGMLIGGREAKHIIEGMLAKTS